MTEVKHVATYVGPNLYASDPVVVFSLSVSIDDLQRAPHRIPLVVAACAPWFTWPEAESAPTDAAGVGRFLVAWASAVQNEFHANLEIATVCVEESGETRLVLGCHDPKVTIEAMSLAAGIFAEIERLSPADVDQRVQDFWKLLKRFHPDYQAQFLIDAARKRGIPHQLFMPNSLYWQFGWGAKSELFYESSPAEDSGMGKSWCRDKWNCKHVFTSLGVPVARSTRVREESELAEAARKIGFPCVTKPTDRGRALGVTTDIRDMEGLIRGYRAAVQQTRAPVLVESYIEGEAHRLMVIRGKLWLAVRRERPVVVGDGRTTVQALAEALRAEGMKGDRPGRYWKPAPLDDDYLAVLRGQGFSPDHVPAPGERVRLHNIPFLTVGSAYINVTSTTHPDVRMMSETIARTFGMAVCGLDYVTADISKSCFGHGVFLEVNPTPGLRIPWYGGADRDEVGRTLLGDKPGRIPLVFVIAPATTHERIAAVLPHEAGIGWVCGERAGIGPTEFPDRQDSFHSHLPKITRNKSVEAVVIVCDIPQIAAQGMPGRRADLAIFLGAASDQLPAWTKVLKEHSDRTVDLGCDAIDQLPKLIASVLGSLSAKE
jgi:cyanophycin synthetase